MGIARSLAPLGLVLVLVAPASAENPDAPDCRVVREGNSAALHSPFFVYRLNTANGLRAESWTNRLTGRELLLGGNPEVIVDVGLPSASVSKVEWSPGATRLRSQRPGEVVFELTASDPRLSATVKYAWDAKQPVLRKFVELRNDGAVEINRLLNCRLGEYAPSGGAKIESGSGRGFPGYLADEYFVSLAHPAGFAQAEGAHLTLRQYPGVRLAPGETFACMEAVYGVAPAGQARSSFVGYVRSRMRRVLRGHDKPYAILESFGGQPNGDFWTTQQYLLDHLSKVARGLREGGPKFDFYSTEFWHDPAGDLTTFHRKNFPDGFEKIRDEILRLGMRPGLWIDSGGLAQWTIGDNPAIRGCFTKGDGKGEICRASEPINSMYKKAFVHHIRENKVGLLKFDNMGPGCQAPCCDNPAHNHLPGPLYSVEAIHSALIDFLRELDAADPDVFLMLYWGYRSPWWLEYADTYFENGAHIEAASPGEAPVPYARYGVTQRLDQALSQILDTPWLGKDSLGVWLSDWPWNSCIGKGQWQEGFVMDICRGSLLAQIWTDTEWLTPPERAQLAELIALLKANADCFGNVRPVLGDPWKNEPYGYACSNGKRGFLAIHNACLEDRPVTLQLGPACGLPDGGRWDIYRWYPHPARLKGRESSFEREARLRLRPYEVVLLEVVPAGGPPSLGRQFQPEPIRLTFEEPSRRLDLAVTLAPKGPARDAQWQVLKPVSASAGKATLTVREDGSILSGGENVEGDVYTVSAQTQMQHITAILVEALTDKSLPSNGPGRAENGNFALTDFRLLAASQDKLGDRIEVAFQKARADFSQDSHGGWPVAAAIDKDPQRGWSIHPQVGSAHAAVFELAGPLHLGGGAVLTFKLTQGQRGHALGRFRISVTADKSPALPTAYLPIELTAQAQLPASASGGILFLTGDKQMEAPRVLLEGREVEVVPVWSDKAYWPCPWAAWRADVPASRQPRSLQVGSVMRQNPSRPELSVHFLPR